MKTKKNNKVNKNKTRKNTQKPTDFLFGYGSLINNKSISYTGKSNIGKSIPVVLKKSAGFRREWVCFPKSKNGEYSFLAIKKSKSKSHNIHGVLAPIYRNIKDFDKRESGYKRIKIEHDPNKKCCFKPLCGYKLPDYKCTIHFYIVSRNALKPSKECPITQNYIDIVVIGSMYYGLNFTENVIKNIKGWKGKGNIVHWINDRTKRKKRKYMKNVSHKKLKKVDKILKKVIPGFFKKRI